MGDIRLYSPRLLRCRIMWERPEVEKVAACAPTFGALEDTGCGLAIGRGGGLRVTKQAPYELDFQGPGARYRLSVIARGDFTGGDGVEVS
jgi:hypothetical protein